MSLQRRRMRGRGLETPCCCCFLARLKLPHHHSCSCSISHSLIIIQRQKHTTGALGSMGWRPCWPEYQQKKIFSTQLKIYTSHIYHLPLKRSNSKKIIKSEQCRGSSRQRCVIKMPATLIDRRGSPTAAKLLQCFVHSAPLVTYFLRHRQLGSLKWVKWRWNWHLERQGNLFH